MFEALDAAKDDDPTADFVQAARDAGVDLADRGAMATFIAGWNARSVRD